MLDDFRRALARVHSDYGFYIDCQQQPAVALASYDLSADERSTLTSPAKLADVLERSLGMASPRRITVTIKGTHDWVNRAAVDTAVADDQHEAKVAHEAQAIRAAGTEAERKAAAVRLMEAIG